MSTTTFKNIRSLSQLVSVVLISINIPLPLLLILNITFVRLEYEHIDMGIRSIVPIFKITSMTNITLGLFASCGLNSKVKLFMRLYLITGFVLFIVLATLTMYVRRGYMSGLITQMYRKIYDDQAVRNIIELNLDCKIASESCRETVWNEGSMVRYYYTLVALPSIFLNLLNFLLLKIAMGIAIEQPPQKLPNFIEKTKVGMNTESLRNKRIISVKS